MKISRLRLLGFKSFVEPTELVIERGLTGVVGPNGCGKSNLLEALRWVMGETSHKSMRAAAMDDVIFSGTNNRPGRNSAEVTIFIDNSERKAPAEFNSEDVIEITRRIERDAGSAYRINGSEARARDVKILFEDAATGARSPALVRQGQIGEIVNSKPEARRRILEDAAGVAGLHSRRHEAELRLKAAEANLVRLSDVMGGLTSQLESLKRQARAARRYKELSGEIRKQEALLFHLSWTDAQSEVDSQERLLGDVLAKVGLALEAEAQAIVGEASLSDTLQPLREIEAKRGAALNRLRIERENFEKEAQRAAERERELKHREGQLMRDIGREQQLIAEARELIQRLEGEIAALAELEAQSDIAEETARGRLDDADDKLKAAEMRLTEITTRAAERRAKRQSLDQTHVERREQVAKIERQITGLAGQIRDIAARAPDAVKLTGTAERGKALSAALDAIEVEAAEAEERITALALFARARREISEKARLAAHALRTERETLVKLLTPARDAGFPAIVEKIRVAAGYEAALAAALGDDLEGALDPSAPIHWRALEAASGDGQLPADVEPLILHVSGPPELARRLKQIGVVDRASGSNLQRNLRPGQRLVSREGDLWRWDGFVAAADGVTAAAQRLAELNRLSLMAGQVGEAEAILRAAETEEQHASQALTEAEADVRRLRQSARDTQNELQGVREALTAIERQARETEARMLSVSDAKARAEDALIEAHERLTEIVTTIELFDDGEDLAPAVAAAQSDATDCRRASAESRTMLANLERERQLRGERSRIADNERTRWTTRSAGAEQQIATLKERLAETSVEHETYAELPALIDERRQKLLDELAAAEQARQVAADELATAETAMRAAQAALRAAQAAATESREAKARIEARLEGARTRRQDEARKIRETLGVVPEGCLPLTGMAAQDPMPPLAEVDRQLTRLKADRERLGGVNLQADEELEAVSSQVSTMETEKADVEQAIAKLRGAIGQLNREARVRLKEAFDTVNGHFQSLFSVLFQGGEARLEMVESEEDPLEGGLEIIARPPGKKPATLSLLSGGEQTLTALSLIFAVFLTNPSPICVLDEVDAPLDDANVDRFCTLMEKMAADTETRFLVITHHPMTMTRMNRLFGVTMAEKGISQLVSVDLETAQSFREAV
ncbi:MAG: chromosome segregation protein SMC [Hyphomicrobium sp.]|nr:MAG: chromosome segregation protein SMC [Hyphomicrobium sp.]